MLNIACFAKRSVAGDAARAAWACLHRRLGLRVLLSMGWLLLGLLAAPLQLAQAQTDGQTFNHMATGFPLSGPHQVVRCETCHLNGIFKGTPRDCASCHVQNNPRAARAKPVNHIPTSAACDSCHAASANSFAGVVFSHVALQPGNCQSCHDNLHAKGKPVGHIATNLSCGDCHRTAAFAPALQPPNHIPNPGNQVCTVCHTATGPDGLTSFAGAQMSHAGISSGCAACHGPSVTSGTFFGITNIVTSTHVPGQVLDHFPTSAPCESCHRASMPAGLVPANATLGNGFRSSLPSSAMVHSGVSGNCASCHEAGNNWLGMDLFPITTRAPYVGFQTRPQAGGGPTQVPDPIHPTSGDCSQCHLSFSDFGALVKPANHIPTAVGAACTACHKSLNYATPPALADIHAYAPSTSVNCAQCHSTQASALYSTASYRIVAPPANHIPMGSAACETCHVGNGSSISTTPVGNGASFANAAFSHSGITGGCAACHGPGIAAGTFYGVNALVVMPPSSSPGRTSHMPTRTTCESCHLASMPGAAELLSVRSVPAVGATRFRNAPPSAALIHAGATGNCSSCHERDNVWAGVELPDYAITTNAPYTGFQTRPYASATPFSVVDAKHPASGDCASCHTQIDFTATVKPAGHIPTNPSAACSSCHKSADFTVLPSLSDIHANAPSTSGNCAQCHASAAAAGFAIPANNFAIVTTPANHVPTGALDCVTCHVGTGSSIATLPVADGARFANSAFSHSGISNGCTTCHGDSVTVGTFYGVTPKTKAGLSTPHLPTAASCETCHTSSIPAMLIPASGAATGMTTFASGQMSHAGITSGCDACHGAGVGNTSFAGITRIVTLQTLSGLPHLPTTSRCESCHLGSTPSTVMAANAASTVAGSTAFRNAPPSAAMIHAGATGACSSCHERDLNWASVNLALYTPTRSAPFKGFQTRPYAGAAPTSYSYADATHPSAGECSNCHASQIDFNAISKPANHIPTNSVAACDACHKVADFSVKPSRADIHANAPSTSSNCAQCHGANVAAGFAIASANFQVPAPNANHVPMGSLDCSVCHIGANSSLVLPVSNTASFSNAAFSHSGITSGCATCHGSSAASSYRNQVVTTLNLKAPPSNHLPFGSTDCTVCHTNSIPAMPIPASGAAAGMTTFANGQMSHAGITSGCDACHGASVGNTSFAGISSIVTLQTLSGLPHLPTTSRCESCHLGSTPSTVMAANAASTVAGATQFRNAPPTAAMIHAGATGACSSCHERDLNWASVNLALYAPTKSTPFKGFQTRPYAGAAPTSYSFADATHPASGECSNCHASQTDFNTSSKPANHIPYAATATCTTCHDPSNLAIKPALSVIHANLQSTTRNCAQCHASAAAAGYAIPSNNFSIPAPSSNHLPMGSLGCEDCHVASNSSIATLPVANGAKFSNSAFSHSGISSGCASCHSAAGVASYRSQPITTLNLKAPPSNHVPFGSTECTVCHLNSIPAMLIPASGAVTGMTTFANGQFSHAGITSGCDACHGASVGNTSFAGISSIVTLQTLSGLPHLPTTNRCESCHLGSVPSTPVAANAGGTAAGATQFRNAPPTAAMIHAGATGACSSCHERDLNWASINLSIYAPTKSAPFKGFQTRPYAGAAPTSYSFADATHTASGECSNCHASQIDFTATAKPANHIPTSSTATCASCHGTSGDYSVNLGLRAIHANAPSTSSNCAQCHGATVAAGFAIPSINFQVLGPNSNHVPMGGLDCSTCHVASNSSVTTTPVPDGAKFSNAAFSHSGISSGCASCHSAAGVTSYRSQPITTLNLKAPPSNHVPFGSTECTVCHLNSIPAMLIPASGAVTGMTTFANGQFSHSGITTGCATCHGASVGNTSFAGISRIVTLQTLSGAAHIPLPGVTSCESCHLGSTPSALVAANATSTAAGGTQFRNAPPTGAMTHAGITTGCNQCHEYGNSWASMDLYPITSAAPFKGFQLRPQLASSGTFFLRDPNHPTTGDCSNCHASFTDFTTTALSTNHIPVSSGSSCASCHKSADFSVPPSVTDIHANAQSTTGNCAQCHSASASAFYSISSLGYTVVGPPSTHVPFGTVACEVCHVASGTGVQLPVVTGARFNNAKFSHTGITSGCSTCHGASIGANPFYGISAIVKLPPTSAGGGAAFHIPASNNNSCEACHLANMPTGLVAASSTAVTPNTLFRLPKPAGTAIHAGISSGCSACHEANMLWIGVELYPPTPSTLTAGALYTGFQTRPMAAPATIYGIRDAGHPTTGDCSQCHNSTTAFSAAGKPTGHIPTTITTCSTCHVTAGDYSMTGLTTNMTTLHTGISSGCISCHTAGAGAGPFAGCTSIPLCSSPPPISYQPKTMPLAAGSLPTTPSTATHIPVTGIACEGCHSPTKFTTFSGTTMVHNTAVLALTCMSCHETGYKWYGVTMVTRPKNHNLGRDCKGCHNTNSFQARVRPLVREAIGGAGLGARLIPSLQVGAPTGRAASFDHLGVAAGDCKSCHDGLQATGMPARHLMVTQSCDVCHRTTSWKPAYFNHNGIAGSTCQVCHNGLSATGKPNGHFLSARSCDSCHKTVAWLPVQYSHLAPAYQPTPDKTRCVDCHVTNNELIPRQLRSSTRNKPVLGP